MTNIISMRDRQPIRSADNTREFFVKWHAVQLAKSYLAFLPPDGEPDMGSFVEVATGFAVMSKFTQEEHAVFIQHALRTLKEGT